MTYLDRLRALEKEIGGGLALPKLTKPGFDGFVSTVPPSKNIIDRTRQELGGTDDGYRRRHADVLKSLNTHPGIARAYSANTRHDGCGVITLAVRHIGTCELVIPTERYDPLKVMQFLDELLATEDRQ